MNYIMEIGYIGVFIILIGILGIILNNKSLIHILFSIELMLLGCNILLVVLSINNDDIVYEILALLIIGVAGTESAIGLALLTAYFRKNKTITFYN